MNPSFAYVYDERLAELKYEREVAKFEAELGRHGIGGRMARMTLFRKPKDTVEEAVRQGAKHIIIVGDDDSWLRMMWFLPRFDVAYGFAPLLGSERLAAMLGIPKGAKSANIIAARLFDTIDVGQVGDRYFLTDVVMPDTRAELDVEGKYRIRPTEGGTITISNLGEGNPKDGLLDVTVKTGQEKKRFFWSKVRNRPETRLCLSSGQVRSETPVSLIVDGQPLEGNAFGIKVLPSKFKLIVGKSRSYLQQKNSR